MTTDSGRAAGTEPAAVPAETKEVAEVTPGSAGQLAATNPKAWLATLNGSSLRKLGYVVLEWVSNCVGADPAAVSGSEKKEVGTSEFVNSLRDGVILAKLANKMQPGAISEIHEGEDVTEEQKRCNLDSFKTFAKEKCGLSEGDLFKTDKVEKGKGFKGLLATLIGLGTQAAEKFQLQGLQIQDLLNIGVANHGKAWVQGILNRIFRRSQPAVTKAEAEKAEAHAPSTPAAPAEPPKEDSNE